MSPTPLGFGGLVAANCRRRFQRSGQEVLLLLQHHESAAKIVAGDAHDWFTVCRVLALPYRNFVCRRLLRPPYDGTPYDAVISYKK